MIAEVKQADAYRRTFLRAHPLWGDGSIAARALAMGPQVEPDTVTADYLATLATAAIVLRTSMVANGGREAICHGQSSAV
jgi:hypothetical protein